MENNDRQHDTDISLDSSFSVLVSERRIKRVDKLALERTYLANRRTLLSYVRTAFSLWIVGLALIKFFEHGVYVIAGMTAIVVGFFIIVTGFRYYRKEFERIRSS